MSKLHRSKRKSMGRRKPHPRSGMKQSGGTDKNRAELPVQITVVMDKYQSPNKWVKGLQWVHGRITVVMQAGQAALSHGRQRFNGSTVG